MTGYRNTWFGERPTDTGTVNVRPPAQICGWCGRLDDAPLGKRCPCNSPQLSYREREQRHREAVLRARRRGVRRPVEAVAA